MKQCKGYIVLESVQVNIVEKRGVKQVYCLFLYYSLAKECNLLIQQKLKNLWGSSHFCHLYHSRSLCSLALAIFSVQEIGDWDRNITFKKRPNLLTGGGGLSLRILHLKEWHFFKTKEWFIHWPSFWIFQVIYVKFIFPNLFEDVTHHSLHLKVFKHGPNFSQSAFPSCITKTEYKKQSNLQGAW